MLSAGFSDTHVTKTSELRSSWVRTESERTQTQVATRGTAVFGFYVIFSPGVAAWFCLEKVILVVMVTVMRRNRGGRG